MLEQLAVTVDEMGLSIEKDLQVDGEREVSDWNNVIRLIRNAISHGRMEFEQEQVICSDKSRNECHQTEIRLTWESLAKLSESVLHALSPILWPEVPKHTYRKTEI